MKSARATVALLLAGLCVGTACSAPRPPSSADPTLVIVGFGDSIVYGSNYPKPWLYVLLARLRDGQITYTPEWPWDWDAPATRNDRWYEAQGARVYNSGIDGNTTAELLGRFPDDVVAIRPDYCLILGGANDIFRDVPLSETQANLARLYDACEDAGITPVACTLTPVKPGFLLGDAAAANALNISIDTLNAWIGGHCAGRGIAVVDFNSAVGTDPGAFLQSDGIHPSAAGHEAMGFAVDLAELGLDERTGGK